MNTLSNLYLGNAAFDSIAGGFKSVMDGLGSFGPYIVAIIIFLIGKFVAGKIRDILVKILSKTSLDDKASKLIGGDAGFSKLIASVVYSLLLLFIVILALSKAGMSDAVEPLKDMFDSFVGFIPKAFGAAVLGFIALFGAKIVKGLLENVLVGARVDERLGNKSGETRIASAISVAVFSFILLMFIPQVLAELGLTQISEPIAGITASILNSVPNIIIAGVVLAIGFLIAQIAQKLIKNLLDASGVNAMPAKLGLSVPTEGSRSISSVVSFVVMISIVVVIVSQSIELLQLPLLTNLTGDLVAGYFNILVAIIIFGFGLLASKFAFEKLEGGNLLLAKVARVAILVMTGVVALQRSQVAPELTGFPFVAAISALAFAGGVGGAIALGLGGKDYVTRWFDRKG